MLLMLMGYSGFSSQVDCAIKNCNLQSKLHSIVCTSKDDKELEKQVPLPSEVAVEYDKAGSLCYLHEQIKQMELEGEEVSKCSSRDNTIRIETTKGFLIRKTQCLYP